MHSHYIQTPCSTLQHPAAHCSTLQQTQRYCDLMCAHHMHIHTAALCVILYNAKQRSGMQQTLLLRLNHKPVARPLRPDACTWIQTNCNTLQHTATHLNTMQHTEHDATHCNTLQHTATRCNTLQHAATCCNTLQLQHAATHCNMSCNGTAT